MIDHIGGRAVTRAIAAYWWAFLVSGIAWFIIALVVLRMDISSVATVGLLLGAFFLLGGVEELAIASVSRSWQQLGRAALGVFFIGGAIWSFVQPFNAFWSLASVLGLILVFVGTLNIIESAASHEINHLWWLGLVMGILEVGLGFWVSQQYFPARALLILLWVGFFAMFRGISQIVFAFQLRSAK